MENRMRKRTVPLPVLLLAAAALLPSGNLLAQGGWNTGGGGVPGITSDGKTVTFTLPVKFEANVTMATTASDSFLIDNSGGVASTPFKVLNDASGMDSSVVITNRGWLGIGVTPTAPFRVNGNAVISTGAAGKISLTSAEDTYISFSAGSGMTLASSSSNPIVFSPGASEAVRITPSGIVQFSGTQSTTLGAGATTFAVTRNNIKLTGDAGGNSISTITGAGVGWYVIEFQDGLVTLVNDDTHAANTIDLIGVSNITGADDTIIWLYYDGTSWYQMAPVASN